ncbi:MAG TPA: tripartite tricarboxylate transporter substrate binding protein [Burkholderiales bacterium]|nr:tripartite tricarboxylate transporter substrate binding protein [Burkholderiales bacterium]
MITRAMLLAPIVALSGLIASIAPAAAQGDYPNRPVRLVSGYAPGGTTSLVGRLIGQKLTESWGQQFILDNRPGGGTLIGAEIVAKSAPDGYTLMLVDSVHVLAPLLIKTSLHPIRDFAAIGTVASVELVLLVHPSVPPNNLAELIAYAKGRPGQLTYATPAIAGSQHLATEMFNLAASIQARHVPYKGAGPALIALVGGEVNMYFSTVATAIPHVKAGKVKTIAVTGTKRSVTLPDVPTFTEAGLPGFYGHKRPGFGIVGPAGMPKAIVDKLSSEILKYVKQPQFRESLINLGLEPTASTPQEYTEWLKAGYAWNIDTLAMLKKKGVKFEF